MAEGSARNTLENEFNIIIALGDIVFSQSDLELFSFTNIINEPPSGYFRFVDQNSRFFKMEVGIFGTITFTDTDDEGKGSKGSGIPFILDQIVNEGSVEGNTIYGVYWSAGDPKQLLKRTEAYAGNSVKAMEETFKLSGIDVSTGLSKKIDPKSMDDDMIWRHINGNMWDQLDTIIEKSFKMNDYLFWAWDDVNNYFKISSFATEQSPREYIIVPSDDAVASTLAAKVFLQDPDFTIWQYNKSSETIDLGAKRKELFPNISYSIPIDNKLLTGKVNSVTFAQMLHSMGDTKYDDILDYTHLSDTISTVDKDGNRAEKKQPFTFGELHVRRLNRNNMEGHKSYEFADVYRIYKRASFCKKVYLHIYNNIGPPLGSKVTFIRLGNAYKVNGISLNTHFSDTYIVDGKNVNFKQGTDVTWTGPVQHSANIVTTLRLISDNFVPPVINSDNYQDWHITRTLNSLVEKSSK